MEKDQRELNIKRYQMTNSDEKVCLKRKGSGEPVGSGGWGVKAIATHFHKPTPI